VCFPLTNTIQLLTQRSSSINLHGGVCNLFSAAQFHSDISQAKIVEAGGSVAGCVFKEDYLDRARQMFLTGGSTRESSGKKSYE
jgi:hypothetical protein